MHGSQLFSGCWIRLLSNSSNWTDNRVTIHVPGSLCFEPCGSFDSAGFFEMDTMLALKSL